jgi:hypothetical protein
VNYLKIFEAYVLRVISFSLLVLGVVYLWNHDWGIGIFLILIDIFVFGWIGQSLKHNKTKKVSELLAGQDMNFKEGSASEVLSLEESRKIAKPLLYTNWALILISSIVLIHENIRFYFAIPLGFLIGMLLPSGLYIVGVFIAKKTHSRNG